MSRDESKCTGGPLIALVSVLILTFYSQGFATTKKWLEYDRLRAVERFLDTVYPQLLQEKGLLTLQTDELNSHWGTLYVFFTRCDPGSGVPGGGVKALYPSCSPAIGSASSEFLHLSVEMGPAKFPIRRFYAQGNLVQERRTALLAEVKVHPEWKEPEMLDALSKAGAKFGPDNKEAFLKLVPAASIFEFSACQLDLGSGTFSTGDYSWSIRGTYQQAKGKYPCSATFEPFDGKLLAIDEV
jgi:hypothetical protein